MKWLALLSTAFVLTAPALAADLDYRRYAQPKLYFKGAPRVVECRYYQPIPTALYDSADVGQFNSYVWRPLPRYCAHGQWRPHYNHHQWRHWRGGISGR